MVEQNAVTFAPGAWSRLKCCLPGLVELIQAAELALPDMLAAAGEPDIVEKVKKGHQAGARSFKVHLDGYNLIPFLAIQSRGVLKSGSER